MRGFRSLLALVVLAVVLCGSVAASAQAVRVGVGFSIAPYAIRTLDAGLEVDLIRAAFRAAGVETQFVYLPNLRLPLAFAEGDVDCLAISLGYDLAGRTGRRVFYSAPTLTFQNYAVSLASRDLTIASIGDLAGHAVLGFQDAAQYLGPEFAAMARDNGSYAELSDQSLQVRMLFSGRVDVVISELRVFRYWRNRLKSSPVARSVDLNQDVCFSRIFPEQERQVAFADETLCGRFDRGLKAIRDGGKYERIVRSYDRAEDAQ
ncbi:extracellular solute-binding protein family 3 [Pseudodesulfovibrio mercurii]|uniref:Extracellular solute-binding protein family 3 n=1 Tax=Pseudodesulfovibrio mercurii TaxID=641491 RepID=F0JEP1_9BACT|nr:transporter substrate-binding domain-containing protein [Pseudodesulfovibrio mercurii]EGB14770.1 extracellular solute-binding protein family 3 [Pseudodesulfovibrio mercurii]